MKKEIKVLAVLASVLSIAFTLNNAFATSTAKSTEPNNASATTGAETKTSSDTTPNIEITLDSLTNYQVNNDHMVSSGLPSAAHLQLLKDEGVNRVIDLIPGDRLQEQQVVQGLSLNYHNVQVEWENPTLANFNDYVGYMALGSSNGDKVLTHCKLNWRGAVFTYLYSITVLGVSELSAKQDLLAIWQPNQTWFAFMNTVIDDFNAENNARIVTTVTPQIEPAPPVT
ncbi:protein tyrosine phosphatase family protein [Alteromonas sp. MMG017]|uniref:protein tyrosine phosphatase family protein n=1 Tax=Alteromonas sp. MMG017 TaxID=2822692 RepID=UPI001B3A14A6|nr:protein tyrosine phosphatase family protein [Alteromonas sp. MMG017]